jgi:hypothetical protein
MLAAQILDTKHVENRSETRGRVDKSEESSGEGHLKSSITLSVLPSENCTRSLQHGNSLSITTWPR